MTTEPTILGKYSIPVGVSLVPNVCAVHYTQKNWTSPDQFDPYRFIDGKTRAIANIPFGTGPRQCVARQFSLYEVRSGRFIAVLIRFIDSFFLRLATNITLHAFEGLQVASSVGQSTCGIRAQRIWGIWVEYST